MAKMAKRLLCLTLSALLLVSAFPVAYAADTHWAQDAVNVLNNLYGSSTFTINDTAVTESKAATLLSNTFKYAGNDVNGIAKNLFIPNNNGTELSREKAALMVCAIVRWPGVNDSTSSSDALNALITDGVINGKPDGTTGAADTITEPELAVVLYRALRDMGMLKSRVTGMNPGEYGYFEVVYMGLRSCLPLDIEANNLSGNFAESTAFTIGLQEAAEEKTGKQEIWEAWCEQLDRCRTDAGISIRGTITVSGAALQVSLGEEESTEYLPTKQSHIPISDNMSDHIDSEELHLFTNEPEQEENSINEPTGEETQLSFTDEAERENNSEDATAEEDTQLLDSDSILDIIAVETELALPTAFNDVINETEWTMGDWTAYGTASNSIIDAIVKLVAEDRQNMDADKAGYFNDVAPTHWAYKGVNYLMQNGLVSGTGNGQFKMGGPLARQELAAVLSRYLNLSSETGYAFSDGDFNEQSNPTGVSGWAVNAIMGITSDATDKTYFSWDTDMLFHPTKGVTRQQLAFLLAGMYSDYDESLVNLAVLDRFNDKASISTEYLAPMAYLVSIGVINGTGEGEILPNTGVDRGTLGTLMGKVLAGLDKSKMRDYQLLLDYAKSN